MCVSAEPSLTALLTKEAAFPHDLPFEYTTLNYTTNEIRLLRILPCDQSDEICCEIFHTSLENQPRYKALSYTWGGSAEAHCTIILNGRIFMVRENLRDALRRLQKPEDSVVIWIDAISIDQNNIEERNKQVTRMKTIYEGADEVVVWLGTSGNDSDMAFSLIHEIYEHLDDNSWIKHRFEQSDVSKCLLALVELLRRPYWSRMWIIQELAVAKHIALYCGNDSVSDKMLLEVQEMFQRFDEVTGKYLVYHLREDISSRTNIQYRGIQDIHLWKKAYLNGELDLFELVDYHSQQECADPRDMIYGLSAFLEPLANVESKYHMQVDYSKPVEEIYTEFAKVALASSQRLDIIARRKGPSRYKLPSWVPDWTRSMESAQRFKLSEFQEPEYPSWAGGTGKANFTIGEQDILNVRAVRIGRIDSLGEETCMEDGYDMSQAASGFWMWWTHLYDLIKDSHTNQEAFARALICDRLLDDQLGQRDRPAFLRSILGAFGRLLREQHPDQPLDPVLKELSDFLIRRDGQPFECSLDEVHEELIWQTWPEASAQMIWDRRVFIMSTDTIGLAVEEARVRDIVCIAPGCDVPIILRELDDHYIFVGEAYVDGYMKGKAMDMLSRGELKLEVFPVH